MITALLPLLPDAVLLLCVLFALVNETVAVHLTDGEAAPSRASRRTYAIALGASILAASGYALLAALDTQHYVFFSKMVVIDPFANVMKAAVAAGFAVTLVYSRAYLEARNLLRGDLLMLAMCSLIGQCVMISGAHFLTLYLGLELMSLPLIAMIALRQDSTHSLEAAIKYYVLSALASGVLLYGTSMIYGATGALGLGEVSHALMRGHINTTILLFGVVFVIAGVAFKLGVAPFHMWIPDIYQGAPTALTLLIGGAPKAAAFAWSLRILASGLLPLAEDWQRMLLIFAALSFVIGNLAGLMQSNIKRMLAYSAIAQMGFVLIGVLSGVVDGQTNGATNAYGAAMFYSLIYALTALGSFGVILALSRRGSEADQLNDLKGLSQRHPMLAVVMLLMMFSLAGIPPTAGFYAKFAVLQALMNTGSVWLAALAVLTSLIGAFYYLRVVKFMYFDAPQEHAPVMPSSSANALLMMNGVAALALGLLPGPLMSACMYAIHHTLYS
ncbi:NADH-ubiquinone oxidoreductase, chain N [Candidatus Glomeribacter gigasporarum BEG34]|uniref:NADH-quinone oxidoreductase subunit N n=1 Tax=Candidatus Glomeribacter gigasporarum BEG34 TaxID=1070319 RepID=G2J8M7_9BURK|nr:NADH-ubiquinone oxidoreductase, chain N [Candidatus Glomeribacter gigasporarum BEG34]